MKSFNKPLSLIEVTSLIKGHAEIDNLEFVISQPLSSNFQKFDLLIWDELIKAIDAKSGVYQNPSSVKNEIHTLKLKYPSGKYFPKCSRIEVLAITNPPISFTFLVEKSTRKIFLLKKTAGELWKRNDPVIL